MLINDIKRLPRWLSDKESGKQKMRVRSLGWEDSLGKEIAAHSSILAWRILWTEEPDWLLSMRLHRVGQD